MSKWTAIKRSIAPWFRWHKPVNQIEQQMQVIKSIEALEADDSLLLVDRPEEGSDQRTTGMVLSYKLGNYYNMCYVHRTAYYAKLNNGLQNYLNARHTFKWFKRKYNPDKELLDLCTAARLTINYRRKVYIPDCPLLSESEPIFITVMDEDFSKPIRVGYEQLGEIELKEYTETEQQQQ